MTRTPSATHPVTRETGTVEAPWETELVLLRDGSSVTVRSATSEDEPALRSFLQGLCLEARRLRFFTGAMDIDQAAHWAVLTGSDRCGLLAHDETGMLVGHAAYIQLNETRAEVAVEVADHLHGQGLGTILIERLALVAEQRGITHFTAEVLAENRAMLNVFRDGFDARAVRHDGPEERVEFLTSDWRVARARFATVSDRQLMSATAACSRSCSRASG